MRRRLSRYSFRSTPSSRTGGCFSLELVEERPGLAVLRVWGKGVAETFAHEGGGHRWQRVPPNDKRGRVHTSTVTVAVLEEPTEIELPRLDPAELDISTCRASGNGGQNVQKTDSAVQIRHVPTGTIVRCETERSQTYNKATALAILRARLHERQRSQADADRADDRRRQIGSGERGATRLGRRSRHRSELALRRLRPRQMVID